MNRRGFLKLLGLAAPVGLIAARLTPAPAETPKPIQNYYVDLSKKRQVWMRRIDYHNEFGETTGCAYFYE